LEDIYEILAASKRLSGFSYLILIVELNDDHLQIFNPF